MGFGIVHLVSRIASASGLSAARPLTCFLLIQATLLTLAHFDSAPGSAAEHWLASPWVTAVALAAAVYEWLVEHEDDAEELQRSFHIDKLLRVVATAATADLLIAADTPAALALNPAVAEHADALTAVAVADHTDAPLWLRITAVGGAIALNLALSALRARLLDRLGDLGLKAIWQKLETGGVLIALGLLAFFPLLVLAALLAATALAGLAAVLARKWERAADEKHRRDCPHCSKRIRVEALRCPRCRESVEPTVWLSR